MPELQEFPVRQFVQMAAVSIKLRGRKTTFLNISRNVPEEKRAEIKKRAIALSKYFDESHWEIERLCYRLKKPYLGARIVHRNHANRRKIYSMGTVVRMKDPKETRYLYEVRWDFVSSTSSYEVEDLAVLKPTPDDAYRKSA